MPQGRTPRALSDTRDLFDLLDNDGCDRPVDPARPDEALDKGAAACRTNVGIRQARRELTDMLREVARNLHETSVAGQQVMKVQRLFLTAGEFLALNRIDSRPKYSRLDH